MANVVVPQLGEGLREVRVVKILRRAGDSIRRGDAIYVIETDKTTLEMESPLDGRLGRWHVAEGDVVPIGSLVVEIALEETEGRNALALPHRLIPPRTREYARSKGLSESSLVEIPSLGEKLLPSDIDAHLHRSRSDTRAPYGYEEKRISGTSRRLIYRMRRSASTVIPGTIAVDIPWSTLLSTGSGSIGVRPTPFQVLAHSVAHIAAEHARFRCVMIGDDVLREYKEVNIGFALSRPSGELLIAVVRRAEHMSLSEFTHACMRQMKQALKDGDQATEDTQILLTHLGKYGVIDAIPTLVAPASSIIFLGTSKLSTGVARIVLTFDHRLVNGDAAAAFLQALVQRLASASTSQ